LVINSETIISTSSSDTTETGGENQQEPLIDRQLELDVLRQHIAWVTETRKGPPS
jgi:hypothetical protein